MNSSLKDINKEHIKIRRGEQKHISVNEEIKQTIKKESGEGETQAETINRVIKTNTQMVDLLVVMIDSVESVPSKMGEILSVLPSNLKNLFEAIVNERKNKRTK